MRVFIGLPVAQEVKQELARIQEELGRLKNSARIKWVEDYNLHATLCFLGEIEENELKIVEEILCAVAGQRKKFDFILEKVSGFPNAREPHVLAVELGDKSGAGNTLSKEVADRLRAQGLIIDSKPWRAHLTLGRVKSEGAHFPGLEKIAVNHLFWPVEYVELIKSELSEDGPRYTVLKRFNFKD